MEEHLRRLIGLAQCQDRLMRTFELDCVCQEYKYIGASDDLWMPFPEPTRVHVLVDERETGAPHRRHRAEYRPQVIRCMNSTAAGKLVHTGFSVRNTIEIGDGRQTTSYAEERRWHSHVHLHPSDVYLTGERFLICRFGRRSIPEQIGPVESEPVRLARAILEPERSGGRGIVEQRTITWETMDNGRRVLRMEQTFTRRGRHVYWLDPERGYALLRFAESDGDQEPETLFEVEELSQVAADFWYPARVSSNALIPSPRQSSPVPVKAIRLPADLPPGVKPEEVTRCVTTHTSRLPIEDSIRCAYEFSNVRVGIEIPADAFEFRRPPN